MLPVTAALWFVAPALGLAVWVAWSDMKSMRIPNAAVLAMAAVWAMLGWPALGLAGWGWGWAVLGIVLAAGFAANQLGLIGAGDAKFAAAMAPLFSTGNWRLIFALFAACLLAAFVAHRGARALPALRRLVPDWESWRRADFPMGLALGGLLAIWVILPILAAIPAD